MKRVSFAFLVLVVLSAVALVSASPAKSEPIVMKFGLAAPDLNPSFWATHYNMFKYEVERKSNNRIKVELIWGGALGSPSDRLKQVMMGQIQGADTAEGPLAQVFKPVQVFSIPYLFENESQLVVFFDGSYLGYDINNESFKDYPIGVGAGISISTGAGLLNVIYAVGRSNDQPFNIRYSKIHIGYTGRF